MPLQTPQTRTVSPENSESVSEEQSTTSETTQFNSKSMALLDGKFPATQRQKTVQRMAATFGNRHISRLIDSLKNSSGGGLKVGVSPEEMGNLPVGLGGVEQVQRACGCGPTCGCDTKAGEESNPALAETSGEGMGGINAGAIIERTIGDGHDLASPRFSGDQTLEAVFDNEQTLRRGSNGDSVRKIQQALIELGFQLPQFGADGQYGRETAGAVKKFQRNSQLLGRDGDGVVGPVTMGNLDERFGTAVPPANPAVTVSSVDTEGGPHHLPFGEFRWLIGWNTTGRDGFIVQEINNVYNALNCDDTPNNQVQQTPRYWEAWRVNSSGQVRPNIGALNDAWTRLRRPNTHGNWSMNANVFFINNLDPAANFVAGGVRDAGDLQSTTTQPGNLGTPLMTRHAGGVWDNCNGNNTHTPA